MFAAGAPWLWALLSFGAPVDKQLECSSWAERGECASNPAYMLKHCAASCAGADTNKAKHDSQMLRECEGYARQGECSRNPAFMLSSCRTQCEAWEKQHGLKMDLDSRCVGWSLLGQCERERETMSRTCNTSCTVHERCAQSNLTGWSIGICDKALRCEALDSARDCSHLAATGACRSDAARMAQVKSLTRPAHMPQPISYATADSGHASQDVSISRALFCALFSRPFFAPFFSRLLTRCTTRLFPARFRPPEVLEDVRGNRRGRCARRAPSRDASTPLPHHRRAEHSHEGTRTLLAQRVVRT